MTTDHWSPSYSNTVSRSKRVQPMKEAGVRAADNTNENLRGFAQSEPESQKFRRDKETG